MCYKIFLYYCIIEIPLHIQKLKLITSLLKFQSFPPLHLILPPQPEHLNHNLSMNVKSVEMQLE